MTIAGLAMLLACGPGGDEPAMVLEPEVEVSYDFRLPEEYDPAVAYPLLLALHDHGQDVDQVLEMWDGDMLREPDFILLTVRAPFTAGAGYGWLPEKRDSAAGSIDLRRSSARTGDARVLDVLDEFEQSYLVDPDFRTLLGIGEGANLAFYSALRHPDIFSSVAAVAGRLDTELGVERILGNADGLEVFLAFGRFAGERAVAAVTADQALLIRRGASVRLFLHDGPGDFNEAVADEMLEFFDLTLGGEPDEDEQFEEDEYDGDEFDETSTGGRPVPPGQLS